MRDKYPLRSIVVSILLLCTTAQLTISAQNTPSTPCEVTLEMYDYGDGWNNAWLSIYQHDTLVTTVTMNGRHETMSIPLTADSVYLSWQSGWYDGECTFCFIDDGGDTLYASPSVDDGGMYNISGFFASFMSACPTCPRPSNLRLVSRTANQLVVAWDGESGASYQVQHAPFGTSSWITTTTSSNTLTINGLSAGQVETVRVRRLCDGETSGYRTANYMTPCETGNCTYTVRFFDRVSMGMEGGAPWGGHHIVVMHQSGAVIDTIHVPTPLSFNEEYYMYYYDYNLQTCVDSLTFGYYSDSAYVPWGVGVMVLDADGDEVLYAPVQDIENNEGVKYYCPTCFAVKNLEGRAIDSVRARVTWRNSGGSQYLVSYRSTEGRDNPFDTILTTDTTVILNNLAQSTYYEVYVRTLCGVGDTSAERYTSFQSGLHRTERVYVKADASGAGDGTSWSNAYNYISQAVEDAHRQYEIYGHRPEVWVAQGTYTSMTTYGSIINLPSDVSVYGGFVGNETSFSQRPQPGTPEFQYSILNQNSNSTIIYQSYSFTAEHKSIVDGFIIQNGYTGAELRSGCVIRNCIIRNNQRGMALYGDENIEPVHVDHCQVVNNSNQYNNAGITASCAVIDNTLIAGNIAGEGECNGLQLYSNVLLRHCDIVGNSVNNTYGSTTIPAVLVSGTNDTMINCIVWGNSYNSNSAIQQISYNNPLTTLYCASTDTLAGIGNILLSADNLGGQPGVNYVSFIAPESGDYRLNLGSACIDAGMLINGYSTTDLAGNTRVYGDGVDMGCYENDGTFVCSAPLGLNVTDITENSAVLHWSSSVTDDYILKWAESESDSWTTVSNLTTNQYTLTGLYKYTTYKFKVTTICHGAETEYSDEYRFKTPCPEPLEGLTIVAPEGVNPTTTYYVPIYPYYRHSGSYLLIRENELGGQPRLIDTLGFQFNGSERDFKLTVTMGLLDHNYLYVGDTGNITNRQEVFHGIAHFTRSTDENPWSYIVFDRGFQYDGTGSIVIKVVDSSDISYGGANFRAYSMYNASLFFYDDNTFISTSYYRPYMYLSGGCDMAPCPKPTIALDSVSDHDATFTCTHLDGTPQLEYKLQSETAYIPATDVRFTDSTCLLSGLRSNKAYDVRLRRICPWGDTSEWVNVQLTTLPYPYTYIYVKADAIGHNDGTTWSNAFTDLNEALSAAVSTSQYYGTTPDVWVAAGVYYGDTSEATGTAFTIQQGVNVYGGFAGTEASLAERQLTTDHLPLTTILDGRNRKRVLEQNNSFPEGSQTVWDGFVLRNGYTSYNGAGVHLLRGTILRNTQITDCSVESDWGEGTAIYASNSVIEHCTITDCGRATSSMSVIRSSYSKLTDCKVSGLTTCKVIESDYDTLRRCEFSNNHITGNVAEFSHSFIENSLFGNNSGSIVFYLNYCTIVNSDIVGNRSTSGYGIIDGWAGNTIKNSILWGNTPKNLNSNLIDSMLYCAVEGGYAGEGNLKLESENIGTSNGLHYPGFVSPEDGDYRLASFSACIDAGGQWPAVTDLSGNARPYGDGIDMGCYEYSGESFCLKPEGVAIERASTAAVVSWVTPEGVSTVDVEYREVNDPSTGSGQENGWTVIQGISGSHIMIDGLTTGQRYEVRLRSHCGGSYSGYTAPVDFVTGCTQFGYTIVGDSTMQSSERTLPIISSYSYSYTQQLYLASELPLAGAITAIQWQQSNATANRHLKVYLGHTSQSSFTSGSDAIAPEALTEVFDGTVAMTSEVSWVTIPLTTPFTYSGSDNLVLAVIDATGSYGGYNYFGTHYTDDYKALCRSSSYTPFDIDSTYDFNPYYFRNNVRFVTACEESSCPVPLLTVQDVDYHSAHVVCQTGIGQRVQLQWKRSGDEGYTTLSATQEQTLDGLRQNTTYTVRARTLCLGDTSNWNTVTFTTPARWQSVFYVSTTGNANANATSWQDATSDLNWAMAAAKAAHDALGVRAQVWVAAGTYYGNTESENAFLVQPYVDVYGGFAGTETTLAQRHTQSSNQTILDGQNQRRVVYQANNIPNGDSVVWDGFTITGGNTLVTSDNYGYGGGAYLRDGFILQNSTVKNCIAYSGGGLYLSGATLRNCVVIDDSAEYYGGVYAYSSNLYNCLIANNSAEYNGGIYLNYGVMVGSTVVANSTHESTSANNLSGSRVYNSVFWGNTTDRNEEESYQAAEGNYYYCAFQNNWPKQPDEVSNCFLLDSRNSGQFNSPAFVQPSIEAGIGHSDGSDWSLQSGSILIDKGLQDNDEFNTDLAGNPRLQGGGIDLGAYESSYTGTALPEFADGRVYVVEGGAGTQNGTSWSNAMGDLGSALMMAASKGGIDVWVAQGRYYGNTEADNAFTMVEGVNVYGGFAGTETSLAQRPTQSSNQSILDGLNSRRVLRQNGDFDTLTIWDGFTLQNGFVTNNHGAAALLGGGSQLRNCVIQYNIVYCTNSSYYDGGAIYVEPPYSSKNADTTLWGCTVRNNYSQHQNESSQAYVQGSALYAARTNIVNCLFHDNNGYNGTVYLDYQSKMYNCVVSNNQAYNCAGVYARSSATINSSVIAQNVSQNSVGGIYSSSSSNSLYNSIVWGNKQNYVANNLNDYITVVNCAIEGGFEGGTDIVDLAGLNDGSNGSLNYVRFIDPAQNNFHLHPASHCLDLGDTSYDYLPYDMDGNARILGGGMDLGAYESSETSSCPSPLNLRCTSVSGTSATFAWTPGGSESQWQFTLLGTAIDSIITVNDTIVTVAGLGLNQTYTAHVRANCGSEYSIHSPRVTFTTLCDSTGLALLSPFTTLTPADSGIVMDEHADFAWNNIPEATSYDFYLWRDDMFEPTTPSVTGITTNGINNYLIPNWKRGELYHWKVVAWNQCIKRSSEVQTFETNPLPDLHVTDVTFSQPIAGQPLTVTYTVKNDGRGATPAGASWNENIWIVSDIDVRYYDTHDNEGKIPGFENLQSLGPGESYTRSVTLIVPKQLVGNYYIFVFADQSDAFDIDFNETGGIVPDPYTPSVTGTPYHYLKGKIHLNGAIPEVEEKDNFFYKSFYILPPPAPDLRVTHIGHPTQAFSNSNITVNWTVTNQGDAAAGGSVVWYDDIYIQQGDELNMAEAHKLSSVKHWAGMDSCHHIIVACSSNGGACNPNQPICLPHGTALEKDSSYSASATVHIPIQLAGDYNIFVVTDAHDTVYESIYEVNNTAVSSQPINIIMTPLSDLQVSNVSMPQYVSPRQLVEAIYSVTNHGAGATELNRWIDKLFLSPTPTYNSSTAIPVAEHVHDGVLGIDESYTDTVSFYIPKNKSGSYYLIVKTDFKNAIFEGENEDNNTAASASATQIRLPDLVVTQVIVPETQQLGEDVTVSAWIKNVGPGTAYFTNPLKTAFFHTGVVFVANNSGQINPGDSIMVSSTVKQGCPGSALAHVHVHTNYYGSEYDTILEADGLSGNIKAATYSVILPDIVAQGIVVHEDTAWSGNSTSLTMTIGNIGTTTWDDTVWYTVYVSNSPSSYSATAANRVLNGFAVAQLTPDSSITVTATATLPNGIEGNYWLHLVVDEIGKVCDGDRSNNEAHSEAFRVNLTPWPDLVISQFDVPDSLMVGAAAQFNIYVTNNGIAPATGSMTTRVFMSILPTYGGNSMKQVASHQSSIDLPVYDETNIVVSGWIPTTVPAGHYYFYAVVDYTDNIYEHTGEDNNVTRSAGQSFVQIYPLDLVVDTITGPDTLSWGQTGRYLVRMRNNSNVITTMPQWQDRVYFNADGDVSGNVFNGVTHHNGLGAGESYTDTFYVTMPYGANDEMILNAICDYNRNNPDIAPLNNQKSKSVGVKSVPTPDLMVSDVEILDSVISGQPFRLAYMVTNVSGTLIDSLSWNDKISLSDVDGYTSWSRQLGLHPQVRYLDSGWFYLDTVTVTIPVPNQGSRFLLVHANAQSGFYESEQTNNVVAVPVNITLPPPGDLTVSHIIHSDTIVAGTSTTIQWSVKNIGNNSISGSRLSSLVYLSRDNVFSSNDKLLGTVNSTSITLAPGDSLVQQATIRISGEGEGNRYFIVKTDVRNAFYEDDENNNTVAAAAPTFVKLRVLPFNTPVIDTLYSAQTLNYKLDIDTNINQTVRLYLEDGDSLAGAVNNIYVMHNDVGSSLDNTYSTADQYSANPELFIPSTRPGYYGVTLEGSKPNRQPQVVKIHADILPFELRNINPTYGGNDGKVTVELNGSRFRPDMEVWLENGGDTLRPEYVIFESFYKAYARFDLNGVDTGDYNIGVHNFCEGEASLDDAFHVAPPSPDGLGHNIIFPNSPRPNRTIAMVLEYGNIGNTDIENVVLEIESVAGSYIALTTEGQSEQKTIVTVPLNIPGEPEGLLRPGSRGTVTIYCYSAGSLVFVTRRLDE